MRLAASTTSTSISGLVLLGAAKRLPEGDTSRSRRSRHVAFFQDLISSHSISKWHCLQLAQRGHPIFRLPVFILQWLQPSLTKAMARLPQAMYKMGKHREHMRKLQTNEVNPRVGRKIGSFDSCLVVQDPRIDFSYLCRFATQKPRWIGLCSWKWIAHIQNWPAVDSIHIGIFRECGVQYGVRMWRCGSCWGWHGGAGGDGATPHSKHDRGSMGTLCLRWASVHRPFGITTFNKGPPMHTFLVPTIATGACFWKRQAQCFRCEHSQWNLWGFLRKGSPFAFTIYSFCFSIF